MSSFILAPTTIGSDVSGYHTFLSSMEDYEGADDGLFGATANAAYRIPFHEPLPGCSQPYQLPAGTSTCPVPGCRGYGNKFKPYWRLNEHMKSRHGWPRKNTQPLLDKRINGKSAKFKASDSAPPAISPKPALLPSILKQPQPVQPKLTPPEQAPARERKEFLSAAEKRALEDWMASQPDSDDDDDVQMTDAPESSSSTPIAPTESMDPTSPNESPVPAPALPAVDQEMCAEAEAYIAWLDTQKPLHPSQNAVRAVLAQMAARKLFRTGQVLPPRVVGSMLALYHILETRAMDVAAAQAPPANAVASPASRADSAPLASPASNGKARTIKFHSKIGTI